MRGGFLGSRFHGNDGGVAFPYKQFLFAPHDEPFRIILQLSDYTTPQPAIFDLLSLDFEGGSGRMKKQLIIAGCGMLACISAPTFAAGRHGLTKNEARKLAPAVTRKALTSNVNH